MKKKKRDALRLKRVREREERESFDTAIVMKRSTVDMIEVPLNEGSTQRQEKAAQNKGNGSQSIDENAGEKRRKEDNGKRKERRGDCFFCILLKTVFSKGEKSTD